MTGEAEKAALMSHGRDSGSDESEFARCLNWRFASSKTDVEAIEANDLRRDLIEVVMTLIKEMLLVRQQCAVMIVQC